MDSRSGAGGAPPSGWLHGRVVDLILGCGLGYLLAMPALMLYGETTGTKSWPRVLVVLFVTLVNTPHYGATIVRVYDQRDSRRRYAFFAVWVTAALGLLAVAASRHVLVASVLITAYLTWSPWHFSGQNYGLARMFLRRRGVDVDPTTKRLFHASFALSAALAIVAIHHGADLVFAPATLPVANTPRVPA